MTYSRLAIQVLKRSHYFQSGTWSPRIYLDAEDDDFDPHYDEELEGRYAGEYSDSDSDDDDDDDVSYNLNSVVTHQPKALSHTKENGDLDMLKIRNMTGDDVDFAARLAVEAFQEKYEWTAGKNNIEDVIELTRSSLSNCPDVYRRRFIAIHEGEPAGVISLILKNDIKPTIECCDACSKLGLCRAICVLHMLRVLTHSPTKTVECYIDHLCVEKNLRNKGIGTQLLKYAENEAKQWKCGKMLLWCHAENRARSLYKRNGYHVIHTQDGRCYTYGTFGRRKLCKMEKLI
ncbi:uncharacterized protein LOC144359615 [Saccoglossus kowalevskii]